MSDATNAEPKAEAVSSPTPVFGSGSTFGVGSGFAGFTGADLKTASPSAAAAGDEEAAPEEECQAQFKPIVQLDEVETSTGEEAENAWIDFKCKLYRFDNDQWKERGVGQVKILEHKENKKVRLLMRQEKTLKIRANHIIMPGTKLQEHSGNDKAWVWSTVDFADEEQKMELFCIRFASAERAQEFKKQLERAMVQNEDLLKAEGVVPEEYKEDETKKEADSLADELKETVKVSEKAADEEAA